MVQDTKSLFANHEIIAQRYKTQLYDNWDDDKVDNKEYKEDDEVDANNVIDDYVAFEDPYSYLTMYGRHRYDESFRNLPKWLQEYFEWHKEQTDDADENTKYAVLACLPEDDCGGLSDRLRPLPFYLMVAKRTNRVLCFYWRKNYGLEEFLQPVEDGIEWRCPSDTHKYYDLTKEARKQTRSKQFKFIYCKLGQIPTAQCVENDIKRINEEEKFTTRRFLSITMYTREPIKINLANMLIHRHSYGGISHSGNDVEEKNNSYLMPDLVNWDYPEMIGDIFRVMFEPVPLLARRVNMTMAKLGLVENEFVSTHVRARYPTAALLEMHGSLNYDKGGGLNFEDPQVKNYLTVISKNAIACSHILAPDLKVFFASDHNQATNYIISNEVEVFDIKDNGMRIKAVGINRDKEPVHTESNQTSLISDFYPVFEDLLIMGGSRCVSHGVGSFGSLAAGLGGNKCRALHRNHSGKSIKCPNKKDVPKSAVIDASEMMFGEQPGGDGKLIYDAKKYHVPVEEN